MEDAIKEAPLAMAGLLMNQFEEKKRRGSTELTRSGPTYVLSSCYCFVLCRL